MSKKDKKMSPRMVYQTLETLSLYSLDTSLDRAIEILQELKDKYSSKDIRLNLTNAQYSDEKEYIVQWVRPENEEEIKKREEDMAESKEWRRQQYENLKKEFGE
jgi:hypothetical protein